MLTIKYRILLILKGSKQCFDMLRCDVKLWHHFNLAMTSLNFWRAAAQDFKYPVGWYVALR